jgi:hypothetical protein
MTRFVLFALVVGLALAVGTAQALTLQPSVSNTQSWVAPDANGDGNPYWDGDSDDSTLHANIGNWLTNTGAFAGGSGPGVAYPYIGTSSAGDLEIFFTSTDPNWAAIRIEVAGLAEYNYFGIYNKGAPPANVDDLLTPSSANHLRLFVGSDGSGVSKTFTPPWQYFGWYLATKDPSSGVAKAKWAWFSESSLNKVGSSSADTDQQHFAFFEVVKNQAYYIGVEDLPMAQSSDWGTSDKDYQDFVVFASVIPDASTWMLFLSGVPALALLRRKRA